MNRTIIREHCETDLGDDAIERLIRDAFTAIAQRHYITFTEELASGDIQGSWEWAETAFAIVDGSGELIILPQSSRLLATVEAISEWDFDTEAFVALDADDWQAFSPRQFLRKFNGTNPPDGLGWGGRVQIEYGVNMTLAERVVIDLVRLAIQYNALQSERAGDYSSASVGYQREREYILAELVPAMGVA